MAFPYGWKGASPGKFDSDPDFWAPIAGVYDIKGASEKDTVESAQSRQQRQIHDAAGEL